MNPFLITDGYKTSHAGMYPDNTSLVFDNFTPRSAKYAAFQKEAVLVFGTTMVFEQIINAFEEFFFKVNEDAVISEIEETYTNYLGFPFDASHIRALHQLGFLPITVRALPEGTLCPIGVPMLTLFNTKPDFYWLPNFLETIISTLLWKPTTSATIAYGMKKLFLQWAKKTDENNLASVDFQGHDFSMRGMDSIGATVASGLGHSILFKGSDSLPVIHGAKQFYNSYNIINSVPATEHSVMCAGGEEDEIETFRRLMKLFPTGILSIVSDTWNLWTVLTDYLPTLKDEILARDGKIVIRPDSGDPVDIICGVRETISEDGTNEWPESEYKGVIELLWDTFGGTTNAQGFKILDPHIGAIYGDSINYERAEQIFQRLHDKGFASTNVVLGIGSFTYQYNTRDTYGFAMKATYIETSKADKVTGKNIFKDPITDDGVKKSAKGLLSVVRNDKNKLELKQECDWREVRSYDNQLVKIVESGRMYGNTTLENIRTTVNNQLNKELGL